MKFTLSFKTPDVLDQLHEVIESQEDRDACDQTARKFLKYGEYLNVEFNTETKEAVVVQP